MKRFALLALLVAIIVPFSGCISCRTSARGDRGEHISDSTFSVWPLLEDHRTVYSNGTQSDGNFLFFNWSTWHLNRGKSLTPAGPVSSEAPGSAGSSAVAPSSATGTLSIVCTTPGASIYVDGQSRGKIVDTYEPMSIDVPAGTRLVEIKCPGFADYSTEVDVAEGAEQKVFVTLDKAEPS